MQDSRPSNTAVASLVTGGAAGLVQQVSIKGQRGQWGTHVLLEACESPGAWLFGRVTG